MHSEKDWKKLTHFAKQWSTIQCFDKHAEDHPEGLAIACQHQSDNLHGFTSIPLETDAYNANPYLRWSCRTLRDASRFLATSLIQRGVSKGTPLIMFTKNQVEFAVCMLAAFRIGLVFAPFSPTSLEQPTDAKHLMATAISAGADTQGVLVIAPDTETLDIARSLVDGREVLGICLQPTGSTGLSFRALLDEGRTASNSVESFDLSKEHVALFTSGSTALPKGCLLDMATLLPAMESSCGMGSAGPSDRALVTTPVHHMFAAVLTALSLIRGAGIIYGGETFSPLEAIRAAKNEVCTFIPVVPAMIHSLLDVLEDDGVWNLPVKAVIVAGMAVTPGLFRRCQQAFRAKSVENMYGMSEGVVTTTGLVEDVESITYDGYVAAGEPIRGCQIRIRHPDTGEDVPDQIKGELHFSGPILSRGYINHGPGIAFYEDADRLWLNTGDQAFIGPNNILYIAGRYKEMIVRGGENLSMAKIESVLTEDAVLVKLRCQIVSMPDDSAGEVPVLVTGHEPSPEVIQSVKDLIRDRLGVLHIPRDVISLQSLGLDAFPLTTSGKINKRRLTEILKEKTSGNPAQNNPKPLALADSVVTIWSRILGVQPSQVKLDAPLSQLADSMLMISARQQIRKHAGRKIPLSEWLAAPNIKHQIELLEGSPQQQEECTSLKSTLAQEPQNGPLQAADMVHLAGEDDNFGIVKSEIENVVCQDGFGWVDVQDVFPTTDFIHLLCKSRVVDTWNLRASIVTTKGATIDVRLNRKDSLYPNLIYFTGPEEELVDHLTFTSTNDLLHSARNGHRGRTGSPRCHATDAACSGPVCHKLWRCGNARRSANAMHELSLQESYTLAWAVITLPRGVRQGNQIRRVDIERYVDETCQIFRILPPILLFHLDQLLN
jgi:acyl-CoA synthetase (AMP-forming)/AMP-acid ligase II